MEWVSIVGSMIGFCLDWYYNFKSILGILFVLEIVISFEL